MKIFLYKLKNFNHFYWLVSLHGQSSTQDLETQCFFHSFTILPRNYTIIFKKSSQSTPTEAQLSAAGCFDWLIRRHFLIGLKQEHVNWCWRRLKQYFVLGIWMTSMVYEEDLVLYCDAYILATKSQLQWVEVFFFCHTWCRRYVRKKCLSAISLV